MNKNRPVNLDLRTMHFPPMAIVSILHRLSGIALFLLLPILLCFLDASLESLDRFSQVTLFFQTVLGKALLWVSIMATLFHLIAGIRHLLMDFGIGETIESGRLAAWTVLGLTVVAGIGIGVWLW